MTTTKYVLSKLADIISAAIKRGDRYEITILRFSVDQVMRNIGKRFPLSLWVESSCIEEDVEMLGVPDAPRLR